MTVARTPDDFAGPAVRGCVPSVARRRRAIENAASIAWLMLLLFTAVQIFDAQPELHPALRALQSLVATTVVGCGSLAVLRPLVVWMRRTWVPID